MRKKELEKQNEELLVKVEKQRLLIEKLNKDLAFEKCQTKTVYVEKETSKPYRPALLDNYANYALLKTSMPVVSQTIFTWYGTDKPLELISFEDWLEGLTRYDLIGGDIKRLNKEVFDLLDAMDLITLKQFFKNVLKEHYEESKKKYLEFLNYTLTKALKKECK
jgi:hypothetical protein